MTVNYTKQSSRNGAEGTTSEVSLSPGHQAQLAKYQAELSKRKIREEALAREQDFLRSSLRSSERLKKLETNSPSPKPKSQNVSPFTLPSATSSGQVNAAFIHDGEDSDSSSAAGDVNSSDQSGRRSTIRDHEKIDAMSTLPRRPVLLVDAVSDILADLNVQVDDDEEDLGEDVAWLQEYLNSPQVKVACDIESKVAAVYDREPKSASLEGVGSLKEVQEILGSASPQQSHSWRHQIEELKRILQSGPLRNLLEAHDGVAEQFMDTSIAVSGGSEPRPPPPGFESIPAAAAAAAATGALLSRSSSGRDSRRSDDTLKHGSIHEDVIEEQDELHSGDHDDDDEGSIGNLKEKFVSEELPGCTAEYHRSEDGILLKTVTLPKGEEPLGATVRNEGEAVIIGRVVRGGIAYRSQVLDEGDEILSVNSLDIRGKDVNEVCDILARLKGTVTFILVPSEEGRPYTNGSLSLSRIDNHQVEVHVRAQFTYQAEDDAYIPCKELGLSFQRGDVLHVISRDDPNWWQAYRDGEDMDQSLAGLIPSPAFQLQREQLRLVMSSGEAGGTDYGRHNGDGDSGCLGCCKRRSKGTSRRRGGKKFYNPSETEVSESSMEDLLTYEVVNLYYPQPRIKRPVVLVGPPGVGRHELRMQLLNYDKERFEIPVAHTTRLAQKGETDGEHYHFISKHSFDEMRNSNQFVEWGHYDKHYYGTTVSSVREIINNGKVCLMSLQPDALKPLRQTNVKPFVIFIAPPPGINMMRTLREKMSGGAAPPDDELMQTIEKGRQMEDEFGHLFDRIVINNEPERSFQQLISEINRLEVEPQWVPIQWLSDYQNGINSMPE